MKKLAAFFLSLVMIVTMAGCKITIDGETTAQSAVTNGTIGLSVSTQNNPFFVTLVEGAEAAAAKLGVKITVTDAGDDVTKQVSDIEDLVSKGISVLIVNPSGLRRRHRRCGGRHGQGREGHLRGPRRQRR